jgi:ComF family protein
MFQIFKDNSRADPFWKIKRLIFAFQTLVFPCQCLKCRTYIDPREQGFSSCFCDNCLSCEPPGFSPPFCPICGHLFDSASRLGPEWEPCLGSGRENEENHLCQTCLISLPKIKRVRAAFKYDGIIKEAIPLLKYQSKLSLAPVFESCLFDAFDRFFSRASIDRIIPIPLHKKKMKKRGFNQSFLLIRNFKKKYLSLYGEKPEWQIDTATLRRFKFTRPQTGFDIANRRQNLKGAFSLSLKKTGKKKVQGENILLVDDVYTTGATCGEAAGVLLNSGAKRVDVLVLARA